MSVKIDVIFPFHRVDSFLLEAIDSLSMSKEVSFRAIVVDDRADQSKNVESLFGKFRNSTIVSTGGGAGYGAALKAGTENSTADVIALFNSDDLVDPMRLALQSKSLTYSDLSIARMERIKANGHRSKSISGEVFSNNYHPAYLLLGSYGANATWCMRSEWWKKNAFFDDDECLDWRIALSAFPTSKITYLESPLYFYRRHPNQITANKKIDSELMAPVYSSWNEFAKLLLGRTFPRAIFDAYGTPWLIGESVQNSEAAIFEKDLINLSKQFDSAIHQNLKSLLHRRNLLLARNKSLPLFDRLKYFANGLPELRKMVTDFVS